MGFNKHCKFSREDAITCFSTYVDANHDGKITVEEIDEARTKYSGWSIWAVEKVAGWWVNTSTAVMIQDCDYDHDGVFTPEDFRRSYEHCVPNQYSLCLVEMVCTKAKRMWDDEHSPKKNTWFSW
jgi:Ca2+-binding EF-hand superfamily protein